ncbi:hypothetical protein [Moorena producens]|uniref:hypothetical protein n=1 Tax=Moorena producens TaxID=1155739 RepID=UPI001313EC11|nr:hypothetical protein [Moorena producens]
MHRYSLFPIPIPDSRSRFPIPDSRFPIPVPYCFLLLHCRTNTLSKRFSHFF